MTDPACGVAPRSPRLIFDFGAVVFDWRPAHLLAQVLPHRVPHPDAAGPWLDAIFQDYGGPWGEFDRGTASTDELVQALMPQTGLRADELHAVIAAIPPSLTPIAGTVDWLRELRAAGERFYYLSNMPASYADHLDRHHDFLAWFDAGVYSARVGLCKPEPAIYELALARFGERAEDCIFLDDREVNVLAARALGLRAVLFRDPAQARAEVDALRA